MTVIQAVVLFVSGMQVEAWQIFWIAQMKLQIHVR